MIGRAPLLLLSGYWIHQTRSALVLAAFLVGHFAWGFPDAPLMIFCLVLRIVASRRGRQGMGPSPWLRRLGRRFAGFRTHRAGRVSVSYPPDLDGRVDLGEIVGLALAERADLARWFGVRPRRRLHVFLYATCGELSEDFERPMGGTALVWPNAVLLASDNFSREHMRHELVHLFAARWNLSAPPLFQEGLAVWLEKVERHPPPGAPWADLAELLDDGLFFEPNRVHGSYGQAGAFTAFLIRRYGPDRYRAFFRKASRPAFRQAFEEHFGMSLEIAWLRCRDEDLAMASLDRRLRKDGLFSMQL